jgi:hypothetical protein
VGSKADFAFGSSFSWIPRKLDNLLSCGMYLSHDTCNSEVCVGFPPTSLLACVTASGVVIVFSSVESSVSILRLRRSKNFLPIF